MPRFTLTQVIFTENVNFQCFVWCIYMDIKFDSMLMELTVAIAS